MYGKVSVIVPVYNVERYLDRCIESITNQTYSNIEVLLIDDGSTDRSFYKCNKWTETDKRIRVIHKKNAGLGMARNTGIEHATGDYICFVDSDDYIQPQTIELAYELARDSEAEIVIFGMSRVNSLGKEISRVVPQTPKDIFFGEEVQSYLLPSILDGDPETGKRVYIPCSACNMLIDTKLIQSTNWRFVSEREVLSEDIYSLLLLYKDIKKVAILKEALYCYCINPASLTRVYREDRFEKNKLFYQKCLELCQVKGYPLAVARACAGPFRGSAIDAMKQAAVYSNSIWEARKKIRTIIDDDVLQQVLRESLKNQEIIKARILFWAMRRKCNMLCCIILKAHNIVTNNQ